MKLINKFKYALSILGASSLILMSCEQDELTGLSPLKATNPGVSISPDPGSFSMIEQDTTIEVTITLSEAQIVDVPFYFTHTSEEGVDGEDFEVQSVVVEKGSTEGVGYITLIGSATPQGKRSISIAIGDNQVANTNYTPQTFTWDVIDYDASITWADCDTDIDLYLVTSGTAIDGSFTVDCVEPVNLEGLPNGEYELYAEYWAGDDSKVHPVTVEFSNNNGENYLYTQSEDDAISVDNPFALIGSVVVNNGSYTAFDGDGNSLGAM
ncbi:hypothetical protein JKA74_00340 [Marivirga sp. S37H4]|uniref:Uncharacterized protein n=1 Tax=Marivirga aurantiaca TaxID=2802615 RepID=A0A934WV26_9BACT|nr:hypothetical protein [Marivirga aurantiaca]MBK6263464.1 hypothetical protein [Marivirga aurantiaca]